MVNLVSPRARNSFLIHARERSHCISQNPFPCVSRCSYRSTSLQGSYFQGHSEQSAETKSLNSTITDCGVEALKLEGTSCRELVLLLKRAIVATLISMLISLAKHVLLCTYSSLCNPRFILPKRWEEHTPIFPCHLPSMLFR